MTRIHRLQRLNVQQAEEMYTVCAETMPFDSRRKCWICGGKFELGDGMTLCFTDRGNKVMHSRCYQSQQEAT